MIMNRKVTLIVLCSLSLFLLGETDRVSAEDADRQASENQKRAYRRVIRESPSNPDAYIALADLYCADGQTGDAVQLLERGLASTHSNPQLRSKLVELLMRVGKYEEAARLYQSYALPEGGEAKKDEREFTDSLLATLMEKKDENPLQMARLLASVFLYRQQPESAIKIISEMLDSHPGEIELIALLGELHMRNGNLLEATRYLERALDHNPKNALWASSLGDCLRMMGDYDKAKKYLEEAVLNAPEESQTHHALARYHRDTNSGERALRAYTSALEYSQYNSKMADEAHRAYLRFNPDLLPIADIQVRLEKSGWIRSSETKAHASGGRRQVDLFRVERRMLTPDLLEVKRIYTERKYILTRDGVQKEQMEYPRQEVRIYNLRKKSDWLHEEGWIFYEIPEPRMNAFKVGDTWKREHFIKMPATGELLLVRVPYTVERKDEDGVSLRFEMETFWPFASRNREGKTKAVLSGRDFYNRRGKLTRYSHLAEYSEHGSDGNMLWEYRDEVDLEFR